MLRSGKFSLFNNNSSINKTIQRETSTRFFTNYFYSSTTILISQKRFVSSEKISNKTTTTNATTIGNNNTATASANSTSAEQQQQQQQQRINNLLLDERIAATTSQFKRFVHTWQLGILGGIGLCMGVGTMFYVFWQPFRSDATLQGTEVASNVLSDARVREGAVQITKEVVEAVLKDPSSVELLVGVLTRLLQQPGTRVATIIYLEQVFNDPLTQDLAKRLIIDVARDEWTRDSLSDIARVLVLDLLKEAVVKKALTDLLLRSATDALRDEELQRTTSQSVRRTVAGVVMPWS
jgi:hypothetical protein